MKKILLILNFISLNTNYHNISETPLSIGNFLNIRKPITNFGFGQNITYKDALIIYANIADQQGQCERVLTYSPEMLYGFTDYSSIYATIPIIMDLDLKDNASQSGIGDLLIQYEHAFFQCSDLHNFNQATIVLNMTFPTGVVTKTSSAIRKPATGFGAVSFFIGFTASHLDKNWYAYISDGGIITTKKDCNKVGNTFFYQFGAGYNLGNPCDSTLDILLEFNGIFTKPNLTNNQPDPNSGGNIIYLGPSLYLTYSTWVIEGGIQWPILQHMRGNQDPQRFRIQVIGSIKY